MPAREHKKAAASRALLWLTLLNVIAVWVHASGYLRFAETGDAGLGVFVWGAFFVHFLLLNAVLLGLLWVSRAILPRTTILFLAPLLFGLQHFFYAVDQKIYALFSFHLNGLVLQVIAQPDASKVLGINVDEIKWAVSAGAVTLAAEFLLAFLLYRLATTRRTLVLRARSRFPLYGLAALVLLVSLDKTGYAYYSYLGDRTVLAQARVIPFYVPVTANRLFGKLLGKNPYGAQTVTAGSYLAYPKRPIEFSPDAARPNIFWIVLESWRADSVTPERTPSLWRYRESFSRAAQHFSGGNATRLGMFSMFYGLNPFYWDHFLAERRGPIFFDMLAERGYEFDVLSSASLNFLGTRDTVFRHVEQIRQSFYYRPEVSDAIMLRRALQAVDHRAPDQPLFQFQFYDSTHAKYRFLPGFDPFKPYLEDINTMDDSAATLRPQVLNRYWNSVYYTDFLLGRFLDGLVARGLFDESIVVITGDHGEEFWEHGHFTHSSAFTDEQLRVPMWIHLPGRPGGEINHLSSHMDLVPTVLEALGATNPPADYSQGTSLFSDDRRFAIASGWGDYVIIDDEAKLSFYATNLSFSLSKITDRHDNPIGISNAEIYKAKGRLIMEALGQFSEFLANRRPRQK